MQRIPELESQHSRSLSALKTANDQISGELSLALGSITQLEVQWTVAKATSNTVIESMEQVNQDLQLEIANLTHEVEDMRNAQLLTSRDQDILRCFSKHTLSRMIQTMVMLPSL